jgi:crotonobetainyl-CoA:carnitine CoA-transferase CaiB-like acyl-CoA transferase
VSRATSARTRDALAPELVAGADVVVESFRPGALEGFSTVG